jgi:8-oxo-dGTP pyrophosphatase MutT (NUDIX family)
MRPARARSEAPVRPRDAASLILYRRRDRHFEVLMGRRPRGARFMPGVYVFPGGAVEAADRRVHPASALAPHITDPMHVGGSAARARAMAVTAVRETCEETGLMLAAPGDPRVNDHPVWSQWREAGLAPALAGLELTGRAITPTRRPIRFHARFFLADGGGVLGRIGGDGELEDIGWVPLPDSRSLPLADVQAFFIEHLQQVLNGQRRSNERPLFTHRGGTRHVRYG